MRSVRKTHRDIQVGCSSRNENAFDTLTRAPGGKSPEPGA
jgi:hypothetical protein